jgi:hypothetical protein
MSLPIPELDWYTLGAVLEWGKVLAAGYLGLRVVRSYERRAGDGRAARPVPADERRRRALRRRVRELETTVQLLEAQSRQSLEAHRFTTALLTRADVPDDVRPASTRPAIHPVRS